MGQNANEKTNKIQQNVSQANTLLQMMRWKMYGQKIFLWSIILILLGLNVFVIYDLVKKHKEHSSS